MGGVSLWHWVIVGIVVMLLFGKGRFSAAAGDIAKGIKSFRKGLTEDDTAVVDVPSTPAKSLDKDAQA